MALHNQLTNQYQIDVERGVVNRGDLRRLKACMKRAENGATLTLGFIGGSITQGSLSTTSQSCYASKVYQWWKEKFKQTDFVYINAGIGGTTSQFGVARVQEDLLCHKPDFVIVEYSVNDDNNDHFKETYEGLIRNIYESNQNPSIILVHNIRYDNGNSAEDIHLEVGKHYELPCISMKQTVLPQVLTGGIPVRDITPDDLHPNDAGHQLIAEMICDFLERVYTEKEGVEEKEIQKMPEPITKNEYEHSFRYQNDNCTAKCYGFVPDTKNNEKTAINFRKGWTASCIDDRIILEIEGTGIAIQYRKSIYKHAPVARVTVDGDESKSMLLDGNFDEDWGDCLYIETVAEHLENAVHTVEIRIVESNGEIRVPFYLVSVIGSQ